MLLFMIVFTILFYIYLMSKLQIESTNSITNTIIDFNHKDCKVCDNKGCQTKRQTNLATSCRVLGKCTGLHAGPLRNFMSLCLAH